MPATAKLSEPVLELVLNCCSHVTPHTCWRRYPGRALEKLNVRVVVRGMLPHVKRSSIEAVVRGSAAHRLVFAQGPGRGLQALRWALPSGVSRALPEKLLLKHGVSACQKPPALAGGVVTVFLAWVPTHHRPLTTDRLTLTLGPAQRQTPRATCSPTPS